MTHLGSLRDPARFGAYVNEITRNLVFDLSRRDRSFAALPENTAARARDRQPAPRAARSRNSLSAWDTMRSSKPRSAAMVMASLPPSASVPSSTMR